LTLVRESIRRNHYSPRTEQNYIARIKDYIIFNGTKHPSELNENHIREYLNYLVQVKNVSGSTQNQALFAILYCYKVLGIKLSRIKNIEKPKRKKRVKEIFSLEEALHVISFLKGAPKLMCQIMFGSGLRLSEVCSLRIKDIDFGNNRIVVHGGKGDKDRVVVLPQSIIPDLKLQIQQCQITFSRNAMNPKYAGVFLPDGIAGKYPGVAHSFEWFYFFPSKNLVDGINKQYHLHESLLQKNVKWAIKKSGINKAASCHTFRHSFATVSLINGMDIRTLQEQLGHASIKTTQDYLHIIPTEYNAAVSPLDLQKNSFGLRQVI
jgi:integron integrase